MKSKGVTLIFLLFTGLNIFLTLNRHSHSAPHTYHGELWADRAGYFVYLPATFQYGFNAKSFPLGLDTLTGGGFQLDTVHDRIVTKYTSGVALLQAPFYLLGHGIAKLAGTQADAYGPLDHLVVDVAAPVLLSIALLLLFSLLRRSYPDRLIAWTLLGLFAGSNLFFYTIGDPGMSHVYSFSLFALLLFLLDHVSRSGTRIGSLIAIGCTAGLIVLVRPTNIVFLAVAPFISSMTVKEAFGLIDKLLAPQRIPWVIVPAILIWGPQLLYWKYAFGSAITWPYSGEGFSNWYKPEITAFWLAPNNGLFIYTPLYALALWSLFSWFKQGRRGASVAGSFAFVTISYLGASWWVWHFGCGFGSRTMVEYIALFAIPITAWVNVTVQRYGKWMPIMVFTLLAAYNLKLVYSYGNCWFHSTWDWEAWGQLVFGPTK